MTSSTCHSWASLITAAIAFCTLTATSQPLLFRSAVARFLQAEAVVPVSAYGIQRAAVYGVDTLLSSSSARSGVPSRSISFFDGSQALEHGSCR